MLSAAFSVSSCAHSILSPYHPYTVPWANMLQRFVRIIQSPGFQEWSACETGASTSFSARGPCPKRHSLAEFTSQAADCSEHEGTRSFAEIPASRGWDVANLFLPSLIQVKDRTLPPFWHKGTVVFGSSDKLAVSRNLSSRLAVENVRSPL